MTRPVDFARVLNEFRRSELDTAHDRLAVDRVLPPFGWLSLRALPRYQDQEGHFIQQRHRETLLLTALSALSRPVAFRFQQLESQVRVAVGTSAEEQTLVALRRAIGCHYPGTIIDECAPMLGPVTDCAFGLLTGTPQPLPQQLPSDYPDLGSVLSALRGASFGFVIQALPVDRAELAERLSLLTAQVHDWSAYVHESLDVSVNAAPTITRANRRETYDRRVQLALEWAEMLIERATRGEAEGAWRWSAFVWSSDDQTLSTAGALLKGLVGGKDALPDPPRFLRLARPADPIAAAEGRLLVRLGNEPFGTVVPSGLLAAIVRFPQESVPGFFSTVSVPFSTATAVPTEPTARLGDVLDRGASTGAPFTVSLDELSCHVLITGMTGAGKTNACMTLLSEADRAGIPFLVIEPAKNEYRTLAALPKFSSRLRVFTLGDETTSPFRLNPFWCPDGYPVATHLDVVKSVFCASFSMYGPMPHIVEEAIVRVYQKRGWDLARSVNRYAGDLDYDLLFPTLADLYEEIDPVVRAIGYAQELTMDVRGAVKTRIKSLLTGAKGLMLGSLRSTALDDILAGPTVLELATLGDDQEKALLMGLLLVGLYEQRQVQAKPSSRLVHLTVLEEAHRILRNVPTSANPEVGNATGKAVETFNNILAEARAYGEGIIISEQIPAKLSPDAIKNTGFKLVHRLHAADDRAAVGDCMVLTRNQKDQLARLAPLCAVAFGGGVQEAVMVRVNPSKPEFRRDTRVASSETIRRLMEPYHSATASARERLPGCVRCPAKCLRAAEAAEVLEDVDSPRYRCVCADVLAASLRVDSSGFGERALEVNREAGRRYCVAAHLAHRFVRERAFFYQLTPPARFGLERQLTDALMAGGEEARSDLGVFLSTWRPVLERKRADQEAVCVNCALPLCIGHEVTAALESVSIAGEFADCGSADERAAFLRALGERIAGPTKAGVHRHLGYCYFVRRSAEVYSRAAAQEYEDLLWEGLE